MKWMTSEEQFVIAMFGGDETKTINDVINYFIDNPIPNLETSNNIKEYLKSSCPNIKDWSF